MSHYLFTMINVNDLSSSLDRSKDTFKCIICQKILVSNQSLKRHMFIHNGLWPFRCSLCNQGFTSKKLEQTHKLVVHENVCKYVCNVNGCVKVFKYKRSLIEHKLGHCCDRPFTCRLVCCAEKFRSRGSRDYHEKRYHSL